MTKKSPFSRFPITRRRDLFLFPLRFLHVVIRRDRSAIRHLIPWLRSFAPGTDPVTLGIPWIAFGAIDWLEQNVRPQDRVLELGSGGSTIFFGSRVAELTSFEHDSEWLAWVQEHVNPDFPAEFRLLPENKYVEELARMEPAQFDLVLIDGGSDRGAALVQARRLVKPGGHLMLDNSDGSHLDVALHALKDLPRIDFNGIGPWNLHKGRIWLQQTTVWRIPEG